MNEFLHPDGTSDVRWPTGNHRVLAESVSGAEEALHAKIDQLDDRQDERVESVRTSARGSPLVSVAAALTLGAVIARIVR